MLQELFWGEKKEKKKLVDVVVFFFFLKIFSISLQKKREEM